MNWGADVVKFGAQNVSFGMLVASNLAPWGPSSDAGGLGSRPWGSRLGFLAIWEGFRGRHLDVFGQLWNNNCVFWHACLQVTFFEDLGV